MPELPDILAYLEALQARIVGQPLERVRIASPFVLRSVDPPIEAVRDRRVLALRRLGKRIVIGLEHELFLVLHLMIAGRLHWKPTGAKIPGRIGLAAFDFPSGTLLLTEAGSKKRASLHLVRGGDALRDHLRRDPPPGAPVSRATDAGPHGGRGQSALPGHARHPLRVERAALPPGEGRVPGTGHGISGRHGRPWALREPVPRLRVADPADRLRGERNELLRPMPDRGEAVGGPGPVTASEAGLAEDTRRARRPWHSQPMNVRRWTPRVPDGAATQVRAATKGATRSPDAAGPSEPAHRRKVLGTLAVFG